jgi:hypothetical protein
MAGQSKKREKSERKNEMTNTLYYILGVNGLMLLCYLFSIFAKGYELAQFDYVSVVILNVVNFICYRMFSVFYKSMFYDYINDIFIINLAVNLFLGLSRKAWYIYFLIPGYICYKVGMYAYNHVKNLDKSNNEPSEETPQKQSKSKITKFNR